jgi:hypothetical protein
MFHLNNQSMLELFEMSGKMKEWSLLLLSKHWFMLPLASLSNKLSRLGLESSCWEIVMIVAAILFLRLNCEILTFVCETHTYLNPSCEHKVVETNSHNKYFEEETQHASEYDHIRPYKSYLQSIWSSPSYVKHTYVHTNHFLQTQYVTR